MEFKQAVVTQNGRALMAKLLAGKSTQFTKIKVSSTIYPDAQLANLTALTNIKQEATAQAYGNNTATVSVVGAIENTGLTTGYYINTVGLYAMDPDKGEILYSVSSASVNGYMPPDTGVSKSGFEFKIYTEVGNATKVDLTVDPAAFATHGDLERLSTLKTAYSWSADGIDRFGTEYPRENIASNWQQEYELINELNNGGYRNGSIPSDTALMIGQYVTVSIEIEVINAQLRSSGTTRIGCEMKMQTDQGKSIYVSAWKSLTAGLTIPRTRIFSTVFVPQNVLPEKIDPLHFYIQSNGDYLYIGKPKLEIGKSMTVHTPPSSVDYENAYPDYIGLAPGYSDKPEDYVWLPEPTKNQKKLEELIELKGQVSDIQDWIQAHS